MSRKKLQDMGCFLKPSWGDLDKELRSGMRVTKDRTFILTSRQKGVLTQSCGQTNPLSHPFEQDPLFTQLK